MDKISSQNIDDDFLVEITDDEGNVFYYVEEMIIPVDGEQYALLVEFNPDHECKCDGEGHCQCGHDDDEHTCECDDSVIIAKVVTKDDGTEEYIEPSEEEFIKAQNAYEKLLEEDK